MQLANALTQTSPAPERACVHFTLQGKGGVGKSLVSSLLAQYLLGTGHALRCVDTDPVNDTLSQIESLKAEHLDLVRSGRIDERVFDDLMTAIMADHVSFVVDTGGTSFVALTNYLVENNALQILRDSGRDVMVHTVVAGGQACRDTLIGFRHLATGAAPGSLVVWLNEYFGPIESDVESATGVERMGFTDFKVYEENRPAVRGIVSLGKRNPDTFGRDIQEMATQKLTFEDVRQSPRWSLMAKCRLAVVEREINEQLRSILQ